MLKAIIEEKEDKFVKGEACGFLEYLSEEEMLEMNFKIEQSMR